MFEKSNSETPDPIAIMDKLIGEQNAEIASLQSELAAALNQIVKLERDSMNWKTTADALAQQRNELQAQYRGMSHAVQLMAEVFARID